MLLGSYVVPRWRLSGGSRWLIAGLSMLLLAGCSAEAEQRETRMAITIPSVKLPLLKLPLTNRRCSNNLMERLMPESSHQKPEHSW